MEKAAIYLRLSRDDKRAGESESISGQRIYLEKYCFENGFDIVAQYVDDGFSGTNFERPDFIRMLDDAKKGLFHVIITKDMSRLGRDYIATGEYIERYFPENGLRYIAVNDGVDTEKDEGGNDMIAFRAAFNDMYARDISKKVRAALDARRSSGKFIGSYAPYGYKKSENDNGKLVPDEKTKDIVGRIFCEFASGKSMLSIARSLTFDGVPTPSAYKFGEKKGSRAWNSVMIKRILSNPTYVGDLTQGFVKKVSYKSKKRARTDGGFRFVSPFSHEGVVSREIFEKVGIMLLRYKSL